LSDRIDLHVHVGTVEVAALGATTGAESSAVVRARVAGARCVQRGRYETLGGVRTNADVPGRWLVANGRLASGARELMKDAAVRLAISARGYHRALRVARTIADLDGDVEITEACVAEALRYRAPVTGPGR